MIFRSLLQIAITAQHNGLRAVGVTYKDGMWSVRKFVAL